MHQQSIFCRNDIFIQAKLWNTNHRSEHVRLDLEATLEDLQLSYVDSYIIHWPQAVPSSGRSVSLRKNGPIPAHHSKSTYYIYRKEVIYIILPLAYTYKLMPTLK